MRKIRDLTAAEIRILGALLEKEQATPDYYPLTMSSLVAACNQKSNRDPVTSMTPREIADALEPLRHDVLVWRGQGSRSEKWSQSVSRRLELDEEEKAILTLLLLRGPQTAGEIRGRSARLHPFDDIRQVEAALERMAIENRELVVELERQPGQKDNRWMQQLGGDGDEFGGPVQIRSSDPVESRSGGEGRGERSAGGLEERITALEARIESLEATLERLVEGADPPADD